MKDTAVPPNLILKDVRREERDLYRVALAARLNGRKRRISVRVRGSYVSDIQADDGSATWLEEAGGAALSDACEQKALETMVLIRAIKDMLGGTDGN